MICKPVLACTADEMDNDVANLRKCLCGYPIHAFKQ